MDSSADLITTEEAARRLGVTQKTLARRIKELDLGVFSTPLDRRKRLLSWSQLQGALGENRPIVMARGQMASREPTHDSVLNATAQQAGKDVWVVLEESQFARAMMLKSRLVDTFSADSVFGAALIQAEGQSATGDIGPFPIQDCYPRIADGPVMAYVTRRGGRVRSVWDIGPGTRIADISQVFSHALPMVSQMYEALLAWAEIDPNDVEFVQYDSVAASISAVLEGQVDIALTMPVTAAIVQAELSNAGIDWLDLDPGASIADQQGAQRHRTILPNVALRRNQGGVPSSHGIWGLQLVDSYSCCFVHSEADPTFVYELVKLQTQANQAKARPGEAASATEEIAATLPHVYLPLHEGAVRFFRDIGVWNETDEARQIRNIELARRYVAAWNLALVEAAARGIRTDVANQEWVRFWRGYKQGIASLGPHPI